MKKIPPSEPSNLSPDTRTWLDGALYLDQEVPDALETIADRVDFLARLCAD